MAIVTVNDKPVDIGSDKLNLVQAAGRAGVFVPHYCWHEALSVVASCRMCLVEVGDKHADGSVKMQPRVVPACQTPAKDGTVVVTNSPKAKAAQQQTLEGILLNHPLDCPVCDKAGECHLQDYSFNYGKAESRMIDEKNQPPNKPYIGDNIVLFADRCIMCSRCVRFTREISGQAELQIISRGTHAEIDIFPGEPLNNKLATNVVDLCPVGALCSKDFLYKQRVWYLQEHDSVCPGCSTGCSIHAGVNKDIVYRLRPRENPQAQGHFMCDEGRLGYHYVNAADRMTRPLKEQKPALWSELAKEIRQKLRSAGRIAGVLSPFLTCEEAFLLAKYLKGLGSDVTLALGPVPVVGADDTYPKDRKGRPLEPVKFTIRAEKCPNRRGVEEILRHFQGAVIDFDNLVDKGPFQAVYLTAGYPPRSVSWFLPDQVAALRQGTLIVQDLLPSPLSEAAQYVIPSASFAEKDGLFVNHANLAQAIKRACRPPGEVRTDGQVFLDLMERKGLLHAETVRAELAREVPWFAPLGAGKVSESGVRLG